MTATAGDISAVYDLRDIAKSFLWRTPVAQQREAVLSLAALLAHRTKHFKPATADEDEAARMLLVRSAAVTQIKNLYKSHPSPARHAAAPLPHDAPLVDRQRHEDALTERASRCTPVFTLQLIAMTCGKNAHLPLCTVRALALYVVPLASACIEAASEWTAVLQYVASAVSPVAAAHAPKLLEAFLLASSPSAVADKDCTAAWSKCFGVFAAAVLRARRGVSMTSTALRRILAANPKIAGAAFASGALPPAAALLLAAESARELPKASALALLEAPGTAARVIDLALRVAKTVAVEDIAAVVDAAIAKLGSTVASTDDCVAVLRLVAETDREAFLLDNARVQKLLDPVTRNPAVFTPLAAPAIGRAFATAWPRTQVSLAKLFNVAGGMIIARCNSAAERVTLLHIVRAVSAAVMRDAPTSLPPVPEITGLVRTTVASAVPEVQAAGWAVVATVSSPSLITALEAIKPLYKQAATTPALRRSMLVGLPKDNADIAVAAANVLSDAESFPADAMLALRFPAAITTAKVTPSKTATAAFTLPALAELAGDAAAIACAADAALRLATQDGAMEALAVMLGDRSGSTRRAAAAALGTVDMTCGVALNLWRAVASSIFGVASSPAAAKKLSASATSYDAAAFALTKAATGIIRHANRITASEMFAELFMCLGHSTITGSDPRHVFFARSISAPFYASDRCLGTRRVAALVHAIFKAPQAACVALDALDFAAVQTAELLIGFIDDSSLTPALAASAVHGLAILQTLVAPALQEVIFSLLKKSVEAACSRILRLDPLTQAVASIGGCELNDFVRKELTARGLTKAHGAKPPKGVSEDDFEAMLKKEAQALDAGRKKLLETIEETKAKLGASVLLIPAPLVALRVCGATRSACRDASAATVATWLCTQLAVWIGVDKEERPVAPELLVRHASEAAASLLQRMTNLGALAPLFVHVAARLQHYPITAKDVQETNNLALQMRLAGVGNFPARLFPVLLLLARGAFTVTKGRNAKAVGAQAHHQLMTLLVANCALPDVANRAEGFQLMIHLLDNFGGVFKLAMAATASLAANVSDPNDVTPLVSALLCSGDTTREACASALARCSFLRTHRTTLLALAVARVDPRATVANIATNAVASVDAEFAFQDTDSALLTATLALHHQVPHAVTVITKALGTLIQKYPAVEADAIRAIRELKLASATVQAFHALFPLVTGEGRCNILHSILDIAVKEDATEELMRSVLTCGRDVLSKAADRELSTTIAPAVQVRLSDIAAKNAGGKGAHKEQLNAMITAWQTIIATRLDDSTYLGQVLDRLEVVLNAAQSPAVHYTLAECVSDLARHPGLRNSEKLTKFGELCMKQTLAATSYAKKKAYANAFAGIIVGAGLIALRRFQTLAVIEDASREKQVQRSGAMILLETLAEHLGVMFEPYMLVMTQTMLDAIAEKDTKIAECADDAAKAMMGNLSDVGLRQLVPRLVEGLVSDQNKKKISSLGLISYIAYCSPKQLAATLPSVIPHITECLFDVNGGVANAAFNALKRVAGVVANSEVQEHIDVLLDAMRHPASETEAALDALLYTRFTTAIDAASLALLIPVVSRGLSERDSSVRGKAAQIVASLVGLVPEPAKTLLPYATELVSKLHVTSQDPQPGVRATSAKAISVLVATLSKKFVDESIEWAINLLARSSSSAEKCGGAQVLMDICGAVGPALLNALIDPLHAGCNNENSSVRESYMYVFVYAPSSLTPDMVTEFLPILFPYVLQGLADSAEKVRVVALQAGTNIINGYGSKHLSLVLEPLLRGVVDENPSGRQSSLLLASKLLIHMVSELRLKHRLDAAEGEDSEDDSAKATGEGEGMDEGGHGSSDVLRIESAREAEKSGVSILGFLEETLGTEQFIRLMAAMHIARSEHNAVVRAEVTTAWQICVASPRTALLKIAPGIVEILVKFASSERPECVELAEKCIEYTCQRIHEMIDTFVIAFARIYHGDSTRHKVGSLMCMTETVPFAEAARLERLAPHIIQVVLPSLSKQDDEHAVERTTAAALVERVSKIMGKRWIDDMVQRQLAAHSVVGVIEIVRVKPKQSLPAVFTALSTRLQDKPLQYDVDLLSELCELDDVRSECVTFYDQMTTVLCNSAIHGLENVEDAFTRFANFITSAEYFGTTVFPEFSRRLKTPFTRAATLRCIGAFFEGVPAKATEAIIDLLRLVLGNFGDSDGHVRDAAAKAFIAMSASLDRKAAETLGDEQDPTALRRAAGRFAVQFVEVVQSSLLATIHATVSEADGEELIVLRFPKLNDCILGFYNRALDYGSASNKLQAIDGIEEVVRHVSATARPMLLNTVMAKCVKTLYERNDGSVVSAVLNLLLHAMDYDKSGKNKVLERTIASSVFGATLSDSPEARTLGLRVAAELLKRDTLYAEPMLSMMLTKKASIDSTTTRAATCRFISVVMRHGAVERQVKNMAQLNSVVRPHWDAPESCGVAAAAGSAIASLALSSTVTDEEVGILIDEALARTTAKGAQVVGGLACLYTLIRYVSPRVEVDLHERAGAAIRSLLVSGANDRLIALWALRLASVLASVNPSTVGKVDAAHAILKRVELNDDLMMSTASYAIGLLSKAFPAAHSALHDCKYGDSSICVQLGGVFDPDFEDESGSATISY